jgi:hypothetical protein
MATTYRVRRQPCSHCGGKVVVVESTSSALGGLLRRRPAVLAQHADYEPGSTPADAVDGGCRRDPAEAER